MLDQIQCYELNLPLCTSQALAIAELRHILVYTLNAVKEATGSL